MSWNLHLAAKWNLRMIMLQSVAVVKEEVKVDNQTLGSFGRAAHMRCLKSNKNRPLGLI
jgi:hypothetical protein